MKRVVLGAVFKYLASKSIATLSFDAAGHGDSDPQPPEPRHAIKRFSNVVNDALMHVKTVLLPFCQANCNGTPVFLMGSSMGALAVRSQPLLHCDLCAAETVTFTVMCADTKMPLAALN